MWNPSTEVFDDIPGFLHAIQAIYPDVCVSPATDEFELPSNLDDAAICGICVGGALVMYCASEGLINQDQLMEGYFDEDYGGEPDPDAIPLDLAEPALRWRFPSPIDIQRVLLALNPTLDDDEAYGYGEMIVLQNDDGQFQTAWDMIGEALEPHHIRVGTQIQRQRQFGIYKRS